MSPNTRQQIETIGYIHRAEDMARQAMPVDESAQEIQPLTTEDLAWGIVKAFVVASLFFLIAWAYADTIPHVSHTAKGAQCSPCDSAQTRLVFRQTAEGPSVWRV